MRLMTGAWARQRRSRSSLDRLKLREDGKETYPEAAPYLTTPQASRRPLEPAPTAETAAPAAMAE
jgi:hypothetical protein